MKNRKNILIGITLIAVGILVWQFVKLINPDYNKIKVQKGVFETSVTAVGQLKAQNVIEIKIPEVSFNEDVDIWTLQIMSIVDEGSIVKQGDEVARLDPKDVEEQIMIVADKLNTYISALEDAKIDSSLTLSAKRDAILKARDNVMDAEIKVEQSTFESKAIQRQTQIEYEKAQRALAQSKRELITERQKNKTTISRYVQARDRYLRKMNLLEQLRSELSIKAPQDGMVIYGTGYDRQKIKVGSQVGRYMPLIATLPDLSSILSVMYVKEIDIAKVVLGQQVKVKVDAFPKKEFVGKIISIANIGQDMPGEFQKGFKVVVRLKVTDEQLLPGMTSENVIITSHWEDALFVNKTAVYSDGNKHYVMVKKGMSLVRKEVKVGLENESQCIISKGLNAGDKVIVNIQEDKHGIPFENLQ